MEMNRGKPSFVSIMSCLLLSAGMDIAASAQPLPPVPTAHSLMMIKSEFIFEKAPFRSCHASTIAETQHGLAAAWFGGTAERNADVGIWFSRHDGKAWSPPIEVANGVQSSSKRYPCWNPVLFQAQDGPLLLFYKM